MEVVTQVTNQFCFVLFLAFLGWGALSDFREFLIPNRICLAILLLYPAYVLTSPQPVDWLLSVAIALAVLIATTVMFSFNLMGGGDVKFLSATVLWAGPSLILPFLIVTGVTGGILAVFFMMRMYLPHNDEGGGKEFITRASVPYGIAIAAGGMFVVGRLLMS